MLNEKERQGIRSIVSRLSEHDLKSLALTITNRLVVIENAEDAINSILMYTNDAASILGRRKVKKEYIFLYLREMGCNISPQSDKCTTVSAVLKFWDSKNALGEQISIIEMEEDDMMQDAESGEMTTAAWNYSDVQQQQQQQQLSQRDWGDASPHPVAGYAGINVNNVNDEVNQMAQQFVGWFYPIFNNGHVAQPNQEDNFGPHHFWRDCQLKIHTPVCEHLVGGDLATSQKLLSLVGQHQLYFNPFDAPQQGIHCQLDPHGLVVVMVGGVLHRADQCIGTFEQKFGLVRDPSAANNWKIKFTELRLAGKDLDDLSDGCDQLEYS